MKFALVLILLSCTVFAATFDELHSVFAFKGTVSKSEDVQCSVEIMPHGTIKIFADTLKGQKNYQIALLDKDWKKIDSYNLPVFFDFIDEAGAQEINDYPFFVRLPYDEKVQVIQIIDETNKRYCQATRSANPPEVRIILPESDKDWELLDGIKWTSSDKDKEEISFDIYISTNEDTNWELIASDLKETKIEFAKPVQATKVMVVAKDGFNAAQAISKSASATQNKYQIPDEIMIIGEKKNVSPMNFSFMDENDRVVSKRIDPKKDWLGELIDSISKIIGGMCGSFFILPMALAAIMLHK
ncbi:MAG: hypothetical protein ABII22_05705 [Candidatus Micrarchaeota archaeon]